MNGIIYRTNETIYTLSESDNTTQHIVSCTLIRIYFLVWSLESSYRHLLVILMQENKNFVLWAASLLKGYALQWIFKKQLAAWIDCKL